MSLESLETSERGNNRIPQYLQVAADMASDTMPIVVVREWDWKSLVTYGTKLYKIDSLIPFVKNKSQILLVGWY
jgi:hypothetical protein